MILNGRAFTKKGNKLLSRIVDESEKYGHEFMVDTELASENGVCLSDWTRDVFASSEGIVFVGACGIAVRAIAPFVKSKMQDPAVVVVDENGRWVISLLSGHIGGANELAVDIASMIGAEPVITTATDGRGLFAVDVWAKKNGLIIDDMKHAKQISAALLNEEQVLFTSDIETDGPLPEGLFSLDVAENESSDGFGAESDDRSGDNADDVCRFSLAVTIRDADVYTLRLIPRIVYIGIGCRKGTDKDRIVEAVAGVLAELSLDDRAVAGIATIDIKKEEAGLLAFCRERDWQLQTFSAEELMAAEGEFSASSFVLDRTGTDNVCERAAFLASDFGKMLIAKTASHGVTVSIYQKDKIVRFDG